MKALAAEPSNQVIGLVRNKKATQDRLAADGIANVHVLEADITDEPTLKFAAKEARRILGSKGLDVLINNASIVSSGFWEYTSLKDLCVPSPLNIGEHSFSFLHRRLTPFSSCR